MYLVVVSLGVVVPAFLPGIISCCPIVNTFEVKLFNCFNSDTLRLLSRAMLYKVSPFFTI